MRQLVRVRVRIRVRVRVRVRVDRAASESVGGRTGVDKDEI